MIEENERNVLKKGAVLRKILFDREKSGKGDAPISYGNLLRGFLAAAFRTNLCRLYQTECRVKEANFETVRFENGIFPFFRIDRR
jgi:hypothetical protein